MTDQAAALAEALHNHGLGCWHPGGSGGTSSMMPPCRTFHEVSAAAILAALPPDFCGCDMTTAHMVGEQKGRDRAEAEIARLRESHLTQLDEITADMEHLRRIATAARLLLDMEVEWSGDTPLWKWAGVPAVSLRALRAVLEAER